MKSKCCSTIQAHKGLSEVHPSVLETRQWQVCHSTEQMQSECVHLSDQLSFLLLFQRFSVTTLSSFQCSRLSQGNSSRQFGSLSLAWTLLNNSNHNLVFRSRISLIAIISVIYSKAIQNYIENKYIMTLILLYFTDTLILTDNPIK